MTYEGTGTITYDHTRGTWRVAITINRRRLYRRAHSYAEAFAIRTTLIGFRDMNAAWRLRDDDSLDLTGLTADQLNQVLALIESWSLSETG